MFSSKPCSGTGASKAALRTECEGGTRLSFGRVDDTIGNPHRAQFVKFKSFELILLWRLDNEFPVELFEATVSQSTVPSPPLVLLAVNEERRARDVAWPLAGLLLLLLLLLLLIIIIIMSIITNSSSSNNTNDNDHNTNINDVARGRRGADPIRPVVKYSTKYMCEYILCGSLINNKYMLCIITQHILAWHTSYPNTT